MSTSVTGQESLASSLTARKSPTGPAPTMAIRMAETVPRRERRTRTGPSKEGLSQRHRGRYDGYRLLGVTHS